MAATLILAIVTTLFWVGMTVVSGQPALILAAAASAVIFGAPFIVWTRRKHT